MLVQSLLPGALKSLVTISDEAPLIEAARLLRSGTDILVVCDATGPLRGVVTKTDVVNQIGQCEGAGCLALASVAMTTDVLLCRSADGLEDLWVSMKARRLKNVPILNEQSRPVGMLNARNLLQALLRESTGQESMMRDYVMGVGYR